jgi:hypothetical protein
MNAYNNYLVNSQIYTYVQSGKASALMETSTYEFILDKHFILHVIRHENATGYANVDQLILQK